MIEESERVVYRTSVTSDHSRIFFDTLDAAKAFVEARLAALDADKYDEYSTFDAWRKHDDDQ